MDLKEIKDHWSKKYPHIFVALYGNENDKFFGKMTAKDKSIQINADTIGELISQGELFLRKVMQ